MIAIWFAFVMNGAKPSGVGVAISEKVGAFQPSVVVSATNEVDKMEGLLDSGDVGGAMILARKLMKSDDCRARLAALEVFGWIGKRAYREIVSMLSDKDVEIAQSALTACEMALDEEFNGRIKAMLIEEAVSASLDEHQINAIMMHYLDIDEIVSRKSVYCLYTNANNRVLRRCAKDMLEHLSASDI